MTAPTYTQQQTPNLFGQTPGYDPFSAFGTSPHGFTHPSFTYPSYGYPSYGFGQQWSQGQPSGQQGGGDLTALVWQLLGYAQQSIQLAQQIVMHSLQQQQLPYSMMNQQQWQNPFQPRGFQRQPMAW